GRQPRQLHAPRHRVPIQRLRLVGHGHGRRRSLDRLDQRRRRGPGRFPRDGAQLRARPLPLARVRDCLDLHERNGGRVRRHLRHQGQPDLPLLRRQEGAAGVAERWRLPPIKTVTATGTYTLEAYETNGTGFKALKIPVGTTGLYYYVEMRRS